jgi:hypothetical protein
MSFSFRIMKRSRTETFINERPFCACGTMGAPTVNGSAVPVFRGSVALPHLLALKDSSVELRYIKGG